MHHIHLKLSQAQDEANARSHRTDIPNEAPSRDKEPTPTQKALDSIDEKFNLERKGADLQITADLNTKIHGLAIEDAIQKVERFKEEAQEQAKEEAHKTQERDQEETSLTPIMPPPIRGPHFGEGHEPPARERSRRSHGISL
jgi:FtsZ-interacting cell division protein ZipA